MMGSIGAEMRSLGRDSKQIQRLLDSTGLCIWLSDSQRGMLSCPDEALKIGLADLGIGAQFEWVEVRTHRKQDESRGFALNPSN
jgi:hypothetical protein